MKNGTFGCRFFVLYGCSPFVAQRHQEIVAQGSP